MTDYNKIFIDTPLFIYLFENHKKYGKPSGDTFKYFFNNNITVISSVIAYMEFAVK